MRSAFLVLSLVLAKLQSIENQSISKMNRTKWNGGISYGVKHLEDCKFLAELWLMSKMSNIEKNEENATKRKEIWLSAGKSVKIKNISTRFRNNEHSQYPFT